MTNCYSPPDKDLNLHTLQLKDSGLLLVGDFNGHSPSWGYTELNNRGEQIEDWMIENNLILINKPNDMPTYLSRSWKTTSTPDIAIATDDIHKVCQRQVMDQLGGSDHRPAIYTLNVQAPKPSQYNGPSWNYKKANWHIFTELTDKLCQEADIQASRGINDNVGRFTKAILQAAKRAIPRGWRKNYKHYWSRNLQKLHDQLTSAREQLERNPTPETTRVHNQARSTFDNAKINETRKAWQEKTSSLNMETDTTKLWKLTKALNEDNQSKSQATILEENDQIYTGKKAATLLAENFKQDSILNPTRDKTAKVRKSIKQELREQTTNPTMTDLFSTSELTDSIRRLKNKKSPGKDGITNEMIGHLGKTAKQKLLMIYNQSWKTGEFPHTWKEAIIIPIVKKGKNKQSKTSYRPISLLSCLGKTMERMVNKRLQFHLETNGLINQTQSGFRKHHSTEDQIAYLTQEIENGFQEKKKTLAVFVDLTKAFDKVWKDGLLLKLLKKNICGRMYGWIHSYLFQRTARVKLERHTSNLVKLREGVPQGGVISPTLFIIFIDDIIDHLSTYISKAIHADDLAIWTSSEHINTANIRIQDAMNSISDWAEEWMVTINKNKTQATCFSLSTKKEQYNLHLQGGNIPQQETPTYLGVTLDRRLSWIPQVKTMESKATKKMAIMKKLAGTKWGANRKILTQVYTGAVRPNLEYASTSWITATKTNTARLAKIQNASLRLITGGIKTTPISAMEKSTRLHTLEERREEKLLRQCEKLKRMQSHPLHTSLRDPTKNRLKRQSINHISKTLQRQHAESLPSLHHHGEPLQDYEDWQTEDLTIIMDLPGVGNKEEHTEAELKVVTLKMLDRNYHRDSWTQVYTDGSAENAVTNGGGGVFIRYIDGSSTSKSISTGYLSTNFRAEASALLEAAQLLNAKDNLSPNIVFLTDCRSLLQSIQTYRGEQILLTIKRELQALTKRTNLILQWIPSHCGVPGNEEADRLSKKGSKLQQVCQPASYLEVKTIIKNCFNTSWKKRMNVEKEKDYLETLDRTQQVIIFRVRTGHCRLLSHLYRLRLAHTDECPCGTDSQTPEHILQSCPSHNTLRQETWPYPVDLNEKLWGPTASLRRTADFLVRTGLDV